MSNYNVIITWYDGRKQLVFEHHNLSNCKLFLSNFMKKVKRKYKYDEPLTSKIEIIIDKFIIDMKFFQ